MYKANVYITLKDSILDPKGKATGQALQNLGLTAIEETRIGKFIELMISAENQADAEDIADTACRKLLANEVIENYEISIEPVKAETTG